MLVLYIMIDDRIEVPRNIFELHAPTRINNNDNIKETAQGKMKQLLGQSKNEILGAILASAQMRDKERASIVIDSDSNYASASAKGRSMLDNCIVIGSNVQSVTGVKDQTNAIPMTDDTSLESLVAEAIITHNDSTINIADKSPTLSPDDSMGDTKISGPRGVMSPASFVDSPRLTSPSPSVTSTSYIHSSIKREKQYIECQLRDQCTFHPRVNASPGKEEAFDRRSLEWYRRKQREKEAKREEILARQLEECTFTPEINSRINGKGRWGDEGVSDYDNDNESREEKWKRVMRHTEMLFKDTKLLKKKEMLVEEYKRKEEDEYRTTCTFRLEQINAHMILF